MHNKVITISGTFAPRHINESLTEEKFAEMFDPPLKIIRRKSKNNSHHFFCIYT